MLKKAVWLVMVVVVVIGLLRLKQYFAPGNVIRRTMLACVSAFEDENLLGTIQTFDRAYDDPWGQSYEMIVGHIRVLHETFDGLEVVLETPEIFVAEDTATMDLTFVLRGTESGRRGTIFGSSTQPCSATLGWTKAPDGWRITTTTQLDIPELRDEIEAAGRRHR